ncbi:molybdate ABC transporter substrate-binding protein [Methylocystis sp. IM3]|uniref:molybdate ABC transporter substrate-binding protein n=1 Tax=unclassified Methylocystis TaxID=2625913 RepID=UPI00311A488B
MIRFLRIALALALILASAPKLAEARAAASSSVTVFAAASLKNALDAVSADFSNETGLELKVSYGGSMALAKQIEAGAPADVFFSADAASMDYLAQKNLIQSDTRTNLLGNTLVVVAPKTSKIQQLPFTPQAFAAAVGAGKIATGDPASVPVGKYAKAALEKLGLWAVAEPHFAFTDNVRAALMFVARDEAPLGIVYLTDARSETNVKIVAAFPDDSHPPIVYPAALASTAQGDAPAKLFAFLKSAAAKRIFGEQGFAVLH